jgi:hypothetical protein
METTPGLEFEFFLAQKLGRTVAELRESLSNMEFVQWSVYYARKAQREELASKRGR